MAIVIIEVTLDNLPWAMERSGKSYDELLDLYNEAQANGYVCTLDVSTS